MTRTPTVAGIDDRLGPRTAGSAAGAESSVAGLDPSTSPWWSKPAVVLGVAFAAYLALSVALWWGVWSSHPTTVTTCGCDDPSLFVWFLEWPAYAIAHGANPFFSTSLFHPTGMNLLSNTSVLAIGIPLAPVTWLFGPVATLNVASTLMPALSALSLFWLVRRWVTWTPAAFIGGLVFGFSPFMLYNLSVDHLHVSTLALLPLMVACLDDLLIRQRRRPRVIGAALGILVTVQFFVGTEMLVIASLAALLGLVLLIGYALIGYRGEILARARYAGEGLLSAVIVAALLLAYPVWFALRGPAHLSGLIWPAQAPGSGGIALSNIWHLSYLERSGTRVFAGYQGPDLPQGEYLGLGLLIVLIVGVLLWHRDRRLWFFGAMAVGAALLALGSQTYWTPWRLVVHLPLVDNVIPARVIGITSLCVAVMLAVVVDRSRTSIRERSLSDRIERSQVEPPAARRWPARVAGAAGIAGALAVAAVALVPMASAMATNFPLTTQAVTPAGWFAHAARRLPAQTVVLTFPPPGEGGSTLAWQAVDGLHFALATGTGPGGILSRAGKERSGQAIIDGAAFPLAPSLAPATEANVEAVRRALIGWGVTVVAVPQPATLVAPFGQTATSAWALGMFTLALGEVPEYQGGTWVWSNVEHAGAPRAITPDAFVACTAPQQLDVSEPDRVPGCIQAKSRPH